VSFTPTDTTDYTTASATATINVAQATSSITWANPANIIYGTALGATQLNATASVAGTFTYTPAAGTVLKAGNGQTLSVSFTPTDTTDYTTASATATINVLQPTPTSTASLIKQDATTQGNWIGAYGSQGYNVVGNASSYPAYATVTPAGQSKWTWSNTTT